MSRENASVRPLERRTVGRAVIQDVESEAAQPSERVYHHVACGLTSQAFDACHSRPKTPELEVDAVAEIRRRDVPALPFS